MQVTTMQEAPVAEHHPRVSWRTTRQPEAPDTFTRNGLDVNSLNPEATAQSTPA